MLVLNKMVKEENLQDQFSFLKNLIKKYFWALPLSTRIKKSKFYANLDLGDGISRVAIISQLRLIDGKEVD